MRTKYHLDDFTDVEDVINEKKSELIDFFKETSIHQLRNKLFEMAVDISYYKIPHKDYRIFVRKIKYLINFGWDLVFIDYKYQIRLESCENEFVKNPLRLRKKARSAQYRQRNSGLGYFQGEVFSLTEEEARDIYSVLNSFYDEISIVSWLSLMDVWLNCTEDDSVNHPHLGGDYNPLQTARNLEKLIEVLYLFSRYEYLMEFLTVPTAYLFNYSVALQELKVDSLEQFSPFYWLKRIFHSQSSKYYIEVLQQLFDRNHQQIGQVKLSSEDIFDIGHDIKKIIEVAWLMIQSRRIPRDWLKLEASEELSDEDILVLIEKQIVCTPKDKIGFAVETLESILKMDWKANAFKSSIDDLVEVNVCNKSSITYSSVSQRAEIELLIESCYLIYLDLRKKRRSDSNWY